MHIPFSMSDEPDLGDEFKGIGGDYEHIEPISFPRCITCYSGQIHCDCPTFITKKEEPVFTQAQMRAAIQANIKAREDLQREIASMRDDMDELEDDLMYAKDALRDVLDWIKCSQSLSALEAIVKRGLRE
ncbi:hypothetical protein vBPpSSYP_212 [Pseudomonas phage vB_PpS_SYP]|nr:hypothetical protein vBPpSSYP_212 [Pseudomonas phage vB_PpS_SYP]